MAATPLPSAKEIRDNLEMLLGRTIEVETDYEFVKPNEEFGACTATYVDALGNICAFVVLDLELSAWVGAALALLPPDAARENINLGSLPDSYIENIYEVLNIFSSLFNKDDAPHLTIDLMFTPGEKLPAHLNDTVTSFVERRDSILHVEGYGKGRMGVIIPG